MKVTLIRQSPKYGTFKILFDHEDARHVLSRTWSLKQRKGGQQYARNKDVYLHRLLLSAPKDTYVDHIDGNGLNNQRDNLRLCSHRENCYNQRTPNNNTSGYKGVVWDKHRRRWRARIWVDGKWIALGDYKSPESAARAYNAYASVCFGFFARLNDV